MSLAIDIDTVTDVLLADGWHTVTDWSFNLDSYEYLYGDDMVLLGGGREPLLPARGFSFTDPTGHRLCGPLTSVLAVKTEKAT